VHLCIKKTMRITDLMLIAWYSNFIYSAI